MPTHKHTLEPFKPHHLPPALTSLQRQAIPFFTGSPGFSAFCGETWVASAGIVMPYPGMGEAWCIAGPLVKSHKVYFHRTVKEGILEVARLWDLRRLQAVVVRGGHERWVEKLGFTREALLRAYGAHGEDVTMFAMFPEAWK